MICFHCKVVRSSFDRHPKIYPNDPSVVHVDKFLVTYFSRKERNDIRYLDKQRVYQVSLWYIECGVPAESNSVTSRVILTFRQNHSEVDNTKLLFHKAS